MGEKRIGVILGAQRSGTTAIGRLLGKHSGVRYCGEIFHSVRGPQDDANYKKFLTVPEANFFTFKERLLANFPSLSFPSDRNQRTIWQCYIENLYSQSPSSLSVIDLKYNSLHHLNSVWQEHFYLPGILGILNEANVPLLHLVREDALSQSISLLRSQHTGIWHVSKVSEQSGLDIEIPIDPVELERVLIRTVRMVTFLRDMMRFYPNSCEVEYATAFAEGELTSATRATLKATFKLENDVEAAPDLKKVTVKTLRELTPNTAQIIEYFQKTQFAQMVRDKLS